MHYQPVTPDDKRHILEELGVQSFEDLVKKIPESIRFPKLNITDTKSELEIQRMVNSFSLQNASSATHLSFLGAGSYEHFVPAAVSQIIGRTEFYTAYTPYQPEASQGTLQSIFEYQSLMTELTGLEVSNGSHYDGSTSLADAALLALRHTDRNTILVSRAVHPHYREVLATYLKASGFNLVEFGFDRNFSHDREELLSKLNPQTAGVIFQTPNFFGVVEDLTGMADAIHQAGSLMIVVGHPTALSLLKSPGEWGADIAVGEGQPLGIPMQFGGPYLGYFCTTRALVRRIPGRLVGMTHDSEGKRAFVLTLQAREQHIRRERAASNICTNQALCALAACVYMTLLGKEGIKETAEINWDRANYLREAIGKIPGFAVNSKPAIFNEFVVKSPVPFDQLEEKLEKEKILPGINLEEFYPHLENQFLVCATETKTRQDLDRFVEALKHASS